MISTGDSALDAASEPKPPYPPAKAPLLVEEIRVEGKTGKPTPLSAALMRPSIGVIGPSDVVYGHAADEFKRLIRGRNPETVVRSYGIGGQDSRLILARFKKQIVDNGHNIAVLSGLTIVNEFIIYKSPHYEEGMARVEANFLHMFAIAKENNVVLIVYGPTPFAGMKKWNRYMQKKADDFDAWLRKQAGIIYVDVTSLGTSVSPGGPLRLKKEFDSGDGIHPSEKGAREIARLIWDNIMKPEMPD
jgi:hypothetical protein